MVDDIAITIMKERLEEGIKMVKQLAEKNNIQFTEALFIQGCQAGISLFIQKETARRVSNSIKKSE